MARKRSCGVRGTGSSGNVTVDRKNAKRAERLRAAVARREAERGQEGRGGVRGAGGPERDRRHDLDARGRAAGVWGRNSARGSLQ